MPIKFYVKKIISLLKEREVEIPVILGGIIPEEDVSELKEMGIIEVFSWNFYKRNCREGESYCNGKKSMNNLYIDLKLKIK